VKKLWHLRQTASGMHHNVTLGTERKYYFDESAMVEVVHIAKIISSLKASSRVCIQDYFKVGERGSITVGGVPIECATRKNATI